MTWFPETDCDKSQGQLGSELYLTPDACLAMCQSMKSFEFDDFTFKTPDYLCCEFEENEFETNCVLREGGKVNGVFTWEKFSDEGGDDFYGDGEEILAQFPELDFSSFTPKETFNSFVF